MTYELLIAHILDLMRLISDDDLQRRKWLGPSAEKWDHPHEPADGIVYDYQLEEVCKQYTARMSVKQVAACRQFMSAADSWYATTPRERSTVEILDSPDWSLVREAATKFIRAFGPGDESPT